MERFWGAETRGVCARTFSASLARDRLNAGPMRRNNEWHLWPRELTVWQSPKKVCGAGALSQDGGPVGEEGRRVLRSWQGARLYLKFSRDHGRALSGESCVDFRKVQWFPLILAGYVPRPLWMPEIMDGTKPSLYRFYIYVYIHTPMIKLNL